MATTSGLPTSNNPVPELCTENAAEWLTLAGLPSGNVRCSELGGGISNEVVLVETDGKRIVVKQSLGQLRTEHEWKSDRERIFREAAALRWMDRPELSGRTHSRIPRLLFEDKATYTIGMEAAPADAEMWKTRLFRGEHDPAIAAEAGALLGSIITNSWCNAEAGKLFGDQTVFDQLRIDPSYRFTASRRPDAAQYIHRLMECSAARRVSLVHGDWSPKNLLVRDGQLWAIDWEVIHYGDPSFDVGFLLNHLLMKSIAMPQHKNSITNLAQVFVDSLSAHIPAEGVWIEQAAFDHVPALLLARVDGKSTAEYLDSAMRQEAGRRALYLMSRPATSVTELFRA